MVIVCFYRENREMNNFISLLDTTLKLNNPEEEEEELVEVKVKQPEETPRIPKSSSMPSMYCHWFFENLYFKKMALPLKF